MSDSSNPNTSFSESDKLEYNIEHLTNILQNILVSDSDLNSPPSVGNLAVGTVTHLSSENLNNTKNIIEQISNKMTTIPSFLKVHAETIPDFDGDINELQFFIESVDSVVNNFYDQRNETYQNVVIFRTVISKLKGSAREVINISCAKSIEEIKKELILHFSDPRNESCLSLDLNNLKQFPNESPFDFYDRVRKLLNTISNYLALHETDENSRKVKQEMYCQQALEVFLAGLKNPYGIMVRTKEPKTMLEALNFIKKEENIRYLQRSHFNPNSQRPQYPIKYNNYRHAEIKPITSQQILSHNYQRPNFSDQSNKFYSPNWHLQQPQVRQNPLLRIPQESVNPSSKPNFPTGPIYVQQKQNVPHQHMPSHTQVFGKPKNVWKPDPNRAKNLPKPTPMSTTSRFTNSSRNPQPSTSKMETDELYNTEQTENLDDFPQPYEYEQHEDTYEYGEETSDEESQNFYQVQQNIPDT